MADPFTGEIRALCFPYAPVDWSRCNGATIALSQNPALSSVLNWAYGGDHLTYFNLPNLLNLIPIGQGQGPRLTRRVIGQAGGADTVALSAINFAPHTHTMNASASGTLVNTPTALPAVFLGHTTGVNMWAVDTTTTSRPAFAATTIDAVGVTTPAARANDQPYLMLNFCICLTGEFPMHL